MNVLDPADWQRLAAAVTAQCPRLTPADLADADRRVDLLLGKIQNRHWVSKDKARRLVLGEMRKLGILAA